MEETEKIQNKLPNQEIDYFKIAKILLSRWYWIVGAVLVCLILANVYLWYTTKIYSTAGTMKFEEKKSEISDLVGGSPAASERSNTSRIQSETIVLQSNPLLLSAIRQLDYRISFYVVGRVLNRTNELYPQKPLDVQLLRFDSTNFFHELITFKPLNKTSFTLSFNSAGKKIENTYHYNIPFVIGPTAFSIKYPGDLPVTAAYLFRLNTPESFIGRIRGGLHISEVVKNSNTISIQETDVNPVFAADVINAIMKEYLNYDRAQRRLSASQMIDFINNQLEFLSDKVKGSGNHIKEYKDNKKIMNVAAASEAAANQEKDLQSQRATLKVQLIAIDQLIQQVVKEKNNINVSFTLPEVNDEQLTEAITRLNNLIAYRNTLLKQYISTAQPVQETNQQILLIKNDALNALNETRMLVQNKIKFLDTQLSPITQQISEMPGAERDLTNLTRDFATNDKVYSFLSEKKLDAQINSAGILPGATIIDLAQPNLTPVSPDVNSIQHSALIFGFLIGLGAIIIIRVLNPYIYDKETVESLTTVPIIGVIRRFEEEIDQYSSQILAISKPKSVFAESVRAVRTNLSFLASEKESKIICITSEVAGEGKSFVAVNLSSTLSLIDKKVILIGADLRRSKLHKTFQVPNDIGLSNYLANQCRLDDIINHSNQDHLDFIISGPVPPNPSELLHNERMAQMIAELKLRYDFIMIDTAPIGLVSDAIPLIRVSDVNVFVIRSGKSKFYAATVPQRVALEYNLDNTVIVLNAFAEDLLHSRYYTTKLTGDNYGTRYYYYSDYSGYESSGYYVDKKKKKWWDITGWFQ